MRVSRDTYDVVIVGGGHNGLTAAAYLARAGVTVLVLERLPDLGGAAVNATAFPGVDITTSRYSYLVSLLPDRIVGDLGLDLELRSRRTASYSVTTRAGRPAGLLIDRDPGQQTRGSFRDLTGSDDDYEAWVTFQADLSTIAQRVAPTMLEPLRTSGQIADGIDPDLWRALIERPIGELIENRFSDDLVRGIVATDALIGTFTHLHDASLAQNRCFLYHVIGNGTGEWRVPVGGMGALTAALANAAADAGAELLTSAGVQRITVAPDGAEVTWHDGDRTHHVRARYVLANVAPWVLRILLGEDDPADEAFTAVKPRGAQMKINLLLHRLPRLRSGIDPAIAFAGTFHLGEEYTALAAAHAEAAAGRLPTTPPGEVYCHSLTDPSILGAWADEGVHAMTYFGLHTPVDLFTDSPEETKLEAVRRALTAFDDHLSEPLFDCILRDRDGSPCIEAKTPIDIEHELAMPGGHIFHGELSWPWAADREALTTPAQRWGVATDHDAVLLCGSGARRGGGVSGIGGHNAAHAVLELLR